MVRRTDPARRVTGGLCKTSPPQSKPEASSRPSRDPRDSDSAMESSESDDEGGMEELVAMASRSMRAKMAESASATSSAAAAEAGTSTATSAASFMIDKRPSAEDEQQAEVIVPDLSGPKPGKSSWRKKQIQLSSELDPGIDVGETYLNLDNRHPTAETATMTNILMKDRQDEEIMKKSVVTPDFEQKHSVPPYKETVKQLKKKRKEEREASTGRKWFDMKAPELTAETKNDLDVLKMRKVLDPKRFYKKNDREAYPKYFQMGTVEDSPADFYRSRVPKKDRKATIVDELLADAEFRKYNKKKYSDVQEKLRKKRPSGASRHMKRLKKQK
ncbi:deoxynucleotidyltransferase terminal-interacting protein 2-like [Branchiostoma floridae x Branchiostoma japonicum]